MVVSESFSSKMLVSMSFNNISKGRSFVRVDGRAERIVKWVFNFFTTVAKRVNRILKIMSKFMLSEMTQA